MGKPLQRQLGTKSSNSGQSFPAKRSLKTKKYLLLLFSFVNLKIRLLNQFTINFPKSSSEKTRFFFKFWERSLHLRQELKKVMFIGKYSEQYKPVQSEDDIIGAKMIAYIYLFGIFWIGTYYLKKGLWKVKWNPFDFQTTIFDRHQKRAVFFFLIGLLLNFSFFFLDGFNVFFHLFFPGTQRNSFILRFLSELGKSIQFFKMILLIHLIGRANTFKSFSEKKKKESFETLLTSVIWTSIILSLVIEIEHAFLSNWVSFAHGISFFFIYRFLLLFEIVLQLCVKFYSKEVSDKRDVNQKIMD